MKKIFTISFLLNITFFFSNCVDKVSVVNKQSSFFDLKEYFENQLLTLSEIERVNKITMIDGKQIEKELDALDFKQELKVFEDSGINKVAWIDKYQVDSIYNEMGVLKKLIYKAIDEKLRTQQLLISFSQNEVDTIEIYNNASGNIAKLKQHLRYIPSFGYSITSTQKTTFSEEHVLAVDVRFLK